ncbi:hypothetical protein GCM10010341_90060 [Streptomyces noursei]|nr:hypothetical protein GCM10010341_90060 [Streptomyces noursei]
MGHLKQRNLNTTRERLRDQVAHALRAALISGELRPGEVYSAPVLAEDFGISATPVREAMLDLTREGLVEPVRNKGFRVTEVNERDLDQYSEIRTLIEVPMVGRITRDAARADSGGAARGGRGDRARRPRTRPHRLSGGRPPVPPPPPRPDRERPAGGDRRRPAQALPPLRPDRPRRARPNCSRPPRNTSNSST